MNPFFRRGVFARAPLRTEEGMTAAINELSSLALQVAMMLQKAERDMRYVHALLEHANWSLERERQSDPARFRRNVVKGEEPGGS